MFDSDLEYSEFSHPINRDPMAQKYEDKYYKYKKQYMDLMKELQLKKGGWFWGSSSKKKDKKKGEKEEDNKEEEKKKEMSETVELLVKNRESIITLINCAERDDDKIKKEIANIYVKIEDDVSQNDTNNAQKVLNFGLWYMVSKELECYSENSANLTKYIKVLMNIPDKKQDVVISYLDPLYTHGLDQRKFSELMDKLFETEDKENMNMFEKISFNNSSALGMCIKSEKTSRALEIFNCILGNSEGVWTKLKSNKEIQQCILDNWKRVGEIIPRLIPVLPGNNTISGKIDGKDTTLVKEFNKFVSCDETSKEEMEDFIKKRHIKPIWITKQAQIREANEKIKVNISPNLDDEILSEIQIMGSIANSEIVKAIQEAKKEAKKKAEDDSS